MADITNIGTSALLAFQRSLGTVSHNISSSTTEGYSRQRVNFVTRPADFSGAGYFGTGVAVSSVSRIYDQFIIDRIQTNTSNFNQTEHFLGLVSQVDNLLADESAGLSPALQNFFNSLQNSADDPRSTPARQVLLSDSEALVQRFHSLDNRLRELASNAERDLVNITTEINGFANALARVNDAIVTGTQAGGRIQPNDLLDERDQLLRELSELTVVRTVQQDDRSLNVFIGNGQGLVIGNTVNTVDAIKNEFNPEQYDIVIQQGQVNVNVTEQISGGRLGAVVDFRNRVLVPGLNSLGRIATGLGTAFNNQHKLGLDLQGTLGQDYFDVGNVDVLPGSANTGSGTVSAALVDAGSLTTSDYEVIYDGANYRVNRLSDGVNLFAGGLAALNTTPIDGFQLTVVAGAVAGDSFQVQPTRNGARNFNLLIGDSARIAHAVPLRSATALTNTGNAELALSAVTDTTSIPLPGDITLTFNLDADGLGNPGFSITPAAATTSDISLGGTQLDTDDSPFNTAPFVLYDNNNTAVPASEVQFTYVGPGALWDVELLPGGVATVPPTIVNNVDIGTDTAILNWDPDGVGAQPNVPITVDTTGITSILAGGGVTDVTAAASGPVYVVLYDPATESSGKQFTLPAPYDGISFTISGTPLAGDDLIISNNTNGVGDNRNGLLLFGLQNNITLSGNNTFQSAFGELVANVGTRTRQAQLTNDAQGVLLEQSVAERESKSGVNLDEEAADLVRLQQAYQAAAQVITVADSLFDELIAAVRR